MAILARHLVPGDKFLYKGRQMEVLAKTRYEYTRIVATDMDGRTDVMFDADTEVELIQRKATEEKAQ